MLLATLTTPLAVPVAASVKVAAYDVPLPEKLLNDPPETEISPKVKSVDGSLRVKVRVAVFPAERLDLLLVTEIVGGVVSASIIFRTNASTLLDLATPLSVFEVVNPPT
jgi:hypothetical protein